MPKRHLIQALCLSFLLVSCAGTQPEEPRFHVTVENLDDQVKIVQENSQTVVDIYSPTGIGSARLELESGRMPQALILRLHLQGLEELRLTSAADSLVASVLSRDITDIHQNLIESDKETPLRPDNPLWIDIEVVPGQGAKKIPLEEGYFEITVPGEFLREAGNSLEIAWLDFYR